MSGRQIRVVVVDDSRLMRAMIRKTLEADGDILCVGAAEDTDSGRRIIKEQNPDVVTLDVEMPGMNGIAFLEKIMTLRPMPVVMVSSHTQAGAEATLAALEVGAVDAVAKPVGDQAIERFGTRLRAAVRVAADAKVARVEPARALAPARPQPASSASKVSKPTGPSRIGLIAIGASTGGVAALGELLARLPNWLPPIVITQHMPTSYTARFAERLNCSLTFDVAEASDGEALRPGLIRIAPGGLHMAVSGSRGSPKTTLLDEPPVSGHRPSVDVLFSSTARTIGAKALGIILTGMGRDGADGMLQMRKLGAATLGQSEPSCVVYGMPKAAYDLGAVQQELDLKNMAARIEDVARHGPDILSQGRSTASGASSCHRPVH
ncbi:MAG: chemotaxis response regulator protein-glutamate methylesterase [Pseudomonadota bacterium]